LEAVWTIKFIQNSISYITKEFKIKNSNSDGGEYLHRISIKSEDKYGRWTGDGFLSFSPKGTRFWMMKNYSNKELAGQTGNWKYQLYDGVFISDEFRGSW
jgi:hypothetical protein